MKSFLKSSALCLLALVSLATVSARAQTRDDRLISAKAGGVNFVAGVVKAGKVGRVGAGVGVEVAKADKKQRDELDLWSRERGRELAKVNGALANRQTNALLASYNGFPDIFNASFPSSGYGLWMWSSR